MAAFRRCVIALAVLAMFAGLASAQSSLAVNCTVGSSPNTVQQESHNGLVGDITVVCTGGALLTDDSVVPRVTIQVNVGANVNSRVLTTGGLQSVTDALLTVDDPGTGGGLVAGFGPNQPATFCATNEGPLGCAATKIYKEESSGGQNPGIPVASSTPGTPGTATAANVFQGVLTPTTGILTFYGVPVVPPVSTGVARVFRITNVRIDPTALSAGAQIQASVTALACTNNTNNNCPNITSVINLNSTVTVTTVSPGLSATTTKATPSSLTVCVTNASTTAPLGIGTIAFGENFGSAFRTRQVGNATINTALTNSTTLQNLPGGNYTYSESGLVLTVAEAPDAGVTNQAGLADFGTRLKATFSNIPTGVHLFVSTANIVAGAAVVPNGIGNNQSITYAELISNATATTEFASDGSAGPTLATGTVTAADGVTAKEIPLTGGAGQAVWEVTNTKGSTSEVLTFNLYVAFASSVPSTTGSGGQQAASPSVVLSFAPTGTAPAASNILPQYVVVNSTPTKAFDLTSCRTILLFPFLTNVAGFDTGIAISNTSTDPFTTTKQGGACNLYFYGAGAPTTEPVVTATIPTATSYSNLTSALAPAFNGYMIAVCNFQFAHGFAFTAGGGSSYTGNMGYLPLVIPDPGIGGRVGTTGESLNGQ